MVKSKRKYYIMGIILLFLGVLLWTTKPTWASSKRTEAVKAYRKFLSGSELKWDNYLTFKSEECLFSLIYVNNDSIPELLIQGRSTYHAAGREKLYTYKNGKIKLVHTAVDAFKYYKKTGIFCSVTFSQMEINDYRKLSGDSSKILLSKRYRNGWSYYDKNNKMISKSMFNMSLKKYTKGQKSTTIKYHKNTAYNRIKYLK